MEDASLVLTDRSVICGLFDGREAAEFAGKSLPGFIATKLGGVWEEAERRSGVQNCGGCEVDGLGDL
jgi:hypothetical protein